MHLCLPGRIFLFLNQNTGLFYLLLGVPAPSTVLLLLLLLLYKYAFMLFAGEFCHFQCLFVCLFDWMFVVCLQPVWTDLYVIEWVWEIWDKRTERENCGQKTWYCFGLLEFQPSSMFFLTMSASIWLHLYGNLNSLLFLIKITGMPLLL